MNKKLTLTIDDSVIIQAKAYAKSSGRSLSDVVENYLRMITRRKTTEKTNLNSIVSNLKGSFKAPADFDYKEELGKALAKRNPVYEKHID